MNSMDSTANPPTRKRLSLVVLFAIFLAPVILASMMFYIFPEWRPTGTINHGQLVTPVRPLPAYQMETLGGERIDETFLRGKWTFIYLKKGPCDDDCIQQLYTIRQVRLAQGKNIDRLQRLMLWENAAVSPAEQSILQGNFPGQVIIPVAEREALLGVFSIDERVALEAGRIYLVDPLGNLMMNYEPDDEPRGMIKDLERLLKYSGLG